MLPIYPDSLLPQQYQHLVRKLSLRCIYLWHVVAPLRVPVRVICARFVLDLAVQPRVILRNLGPNSYNILYEATSSLFQPAVNYSPFVTPLPTQMQSANIWPMVWIYLLQLTFAREHEGVQNRTHCYSGRVRNPAFRGVMHKGYTRGMHDPYFKVTFIGTEQKMLL